MEESMTIPTFNWKGEICDHIISTRIVDRRTRQYNKDLRIVTIFAIEVFCNECGKHFAYAEAEGEGDLTSIK